MAEETPNLRIWNQVCKTDPVNAKEVSIGARSFTAISAMSQMQKATEVFGPCGTGWGYNFEVMEEAPPTVLVFHVTLWYENHDQEVQQFGSCPWNIGERLDQDAPKKALTDGVTKCLSLLGFNADVHLGKFDDNKYVQEMNEEFGHDAGPEQTVRPPPSEPYRVPDGDDAPTWFNDHVPFGKYKGKEWGWMASQKTGSSVYGWLEWASKNMRKGDVADRSRYCHGWIKAGAEPKLPVDDQRLMDPEGGPEEPPPPGDESEPPF